jgi:hypothetical protein
VEGITASWAGLERKAQEEPASLSGAVNSGKARRGQWGKFSCVKTRSAPFHLLCCPVDLSNPN